MTMYHARLWECELCGVLHITAPDLGAFRKAEYDNKSKSAMPVASFVEMLDEIMNENTLKDGKAISALMPEGWRKMHVERTDAIDEGLKLKGDICGECVNAFAETFRKRRRAGADRKTNNQLWGRDATTSWLGPKK